MAGNGGVKKFGKYGATRRMLGLTLAEVAKMTGLAESTMKAIDGGACPSERSKLMVMDLYSELVAALEEETRSKFLDLVEALQQVNACSFSKEKRISKTTAFRMALGLTVATVEQEAKISKYQMSQIEQNKISADDLRNRLEDYLTKVYSALPEEEQRKVELREAAIRIADFPQKNPFRRYLKDFIDKKLNKIVVNNIEVNKKVKEDPEFEKEYIRTLEEENDDLKLKLSACYDQHHCDEDIIAELKEKNEALQERINFLEGEIKRISERGTDECVLEDICTPGMTFHNCTVTININRKEEV